MELTSQINTEQLTTFIEDVIREYDYSSHIEECLDGSNALNHAVEMQFDDLSSSIQEDIEDIKNDLNNVENEAKRNTDSLILINSGIKAYLSAIGQEEIKQLKEELTAAKNKITALQLVAVNQNTL